MPSRNKYSFNSICYLGYLDRVWFSDRLGTLSGGRYHTGPEYSRARNVVRPDKQKVIDEVWDDERVESFLHKLPMGDENPDYSVLLNAYRAMRPEDFQRFVDLYVAAGRDVNARSRSGETLRETIAGHRLSEPFVRILDAAGA